MGNVTRRWRGQRSVRFVKRRQNREGVVDGEGDCTHPGPVRSLRVKNNSVWSACRVECAPCTRSTANPFHGFILTATLFIVPQTFRLFSFASTCVFPGMIKTSGSARRLGKNITVDECLLKPWQIRRSANAFNHIKPLSTVRIFGNKNTTGKHVRYSVILEFSGHSKVIPSVVNRCMLITAENKQANVSSSWKSCLSTHFFSLRGN